MDARDVSPLYDSMRRYGLPGVLTPVDPQNRSGAWRVVDPVDQRDITDATLAAVAAADRHQPTRGFVIAR
ncbi:hypothetical protein Q5762_12715 [Streptomyces sp. P9(2023)]|uniref:hypothetical protein n=1 Tax=Streptomyces sp. P9(2023) TaxID=3064394 RepID=UPI0028F41A52|nr:hypothetical protein [Streptomyces sp. P9(2023)]MDT9689188.1 hypothetical protein [Streptomyces sp. P9(2023)]